MRDIERFLDQVVDNEAADGPEVRDGSSHQIKHHNRDAVPSAADLSGSSAPKPSPLHGILRRWYVVLLVSILVAGLGVAGVWLIMEPGYIVRGYIKIASVQENPLTGQMDQVNFNGPQTYALSVLSPEIIERVADDLGPRNLDFFSKNYDLVSRILSKVGFEPQGNAKEPAMILHDAKRAGIIVSSAVRDTVLIAVTMKSLAPEEAKRIVNSILENFKNYAKSGDDERTNDSLHGLKVERDKLIESMKEARGEIASWAAQYGSSVLTVEQELATLREGSILERLSGIKTRIVDLEIQVGILTEQGDANTPMLRNTAGLNQFVNEDSMVRELTQDIISLKKDLIIAKQTLNENNPVVIEKRILVKEFEEQLEQVRSDLEVRYYDIIREQQSASYTRNLAAAELELNHLRTEQELLHAERAAVDTEQKEVGAASIAIQNAQFRYTLDKDLHDQVSRRIKQIEMEGNQEPLIDIYSVAAVESYEDERGKMSAAAVFGGLGLGCLAAFLIDKRDKRLHSPEEIRQHVRNPLLGTISQVNLKKEPRLADTFIGDYQTVRTNLALLVKEGIPNTFAVVSPGSQEGKTTFCINLATSLAGAGKRVLLVDGDLRRPNVLRTLGIDLDSIGTHKVVDDTGFDYSLYSVPPSNLDVLVPEIRCMADPFELISAPILVDQIFELGTQYDHIIIDTPPILAFPDAVLLAHIAGTALVVTFCGRTFGPELAESVARMEKANVGVLGLVMNNVPTDHGYNKYGYGYNYRYDRYKNNGQKRMLAHAAQDGSR